MFSKSVKLTTLTSYGQIGVGIICSLLLIRIATKNLTPEEFGLWSFVFGSIGYFLMLDFGFSYSLGRIFADPIYSKDKKNLSSKISLAFLVLAAQGVLIAFVGIMLMEPIFNWFHISTKIRGNGEKLWIWCIVAQSLLFPLRVFPAIIHAQNRVYLVNILSIVNQVANLIVFFWFITHQAGVVAYAYSSAVSTLLMYLGCIVCVFPGKNPMELTLARPLYSEIIRIMKYAFSVFASSFASQASGAAQIMIITRLMGLDAVASYSVTSRIPALLSNMALKPFEAHRPQWIAEYCNDNIREFKMGYAKAISLSVFLLGAAFITSLYFNPIFVKYWTKQEFFAGNSFNALITIASALSLLGWQLNITFQMSKKMKFYSIVTIFGAVGEILLSMLLVHHYGLIGVPLAAICFSGGIVLIYNYKSGLATLGIRQLGMLKTLFRIAMVLAAGFLIWVCVCNISILQGFGYYIFGFVLSFGLLVIIFRKESSLTLSRNGF